MSLNNRGRRLASRCIFVYADRASWWIIVYSATSGGSIEYLTTVYIEIPHVVEGYSAADRAIRDTGRIVARFEKYQ